jgi:hypothetical protein
MEDRDPRTPDLKENLDQSVIGQATRANEQMWSDGCRRLRIGEVLYVAYRVLDHVGDLFFGESVLHCTIGEPYRHRGTVPQNQVM